MELKKIHWIGIIIGGVILLISLFFMNTQFFFFILWFGIMIAAVPFVMTSIQQTKESTEKEELFLEFTRNLVESVRTGTPISKSIINMKKKPFGVLSKNIEKLGNQIAMGIPLREALEIFAKDVNNETVTRTITLIGQAEKSGGTIGEILESVAKAVNMADKLKKERKAAVSTLVVQGYIIFFVFLIIVMVMQFYIIPMISGIASVGTISTTGITTSSSDTTALDVSQAFLYLLIIQGLFSGLTIGKLSEGSLKPGIKHSFALVALAFLVSTITNVLLG
ncbi:type II secretion system F family protein [Candidatus Pacearchaeota archaeon]|jgi:flagellar protein FlaJ|nr:type II secretion system F family protein [Candidatus Pacearchaeota archaeon]